VLTAKQGEQKRTRIAILPTIRSQVFMVIHGTFRLGFYMNWYDAGSLKISYPGFSPGETRKN
jgi:hypothetical protein